MKAPSALNTILDRLVLPGALTFSKIGYVLRSHRFEPIAANLEGRTMVVTGATGGLGKETAEWLARLGARVVLVARNGEKAERVITEIADTTGNENLGIQLADLSLMREVREVAARIAATEPRVDVLINNAGALFNERSETDEGFERTLALDLMAPFLLTNLLMPTLTTGAPSRVVNVASGGMYTQGISLRDIQFEHGYDGPKAYARAKRGLVILSELWAEMHGPEVAISSMHPGWAATPGVTDALPGFDKVMGPLLRTPAQGVDTIVWLAAADEPANASGEFYLDRQPHVKTVLPGTDVDRPSKLALWYLLAAMTEWEGPGPT